MAERTHLLIVEGPDKGRSLTLAPGGARFGRSSKNDIVLNDAKASRHHCRLFFTGDGKLAVSDLGSANQTLVNDVPIQEARLHVGDRLAVGDTVFSVQHDGRHGGADSGRVDLGLGQVSPPPRVARAAGRNRLWLYGAAAALVVLALILVLSRRGRPPAESLNSSIPPAPASRLPLEIAYEKVLADGERIFRYHLAITADDQIHIRIDDTDTTHIRESGRVKPALLEELAAFIEASGFFELDDAYEGLQRGVLDLWDVSVTLNKRTRRVKVVNRGEPKVFKTVRERLENFGQVELGLWAVQYPPEKLVEMANQAYLQALKMYDSRQVAHGNLAAAIKSLEEADFFLRTIDPKPAFYPELLARLATYREELDQRYIDQNFLAERAIRVGDMEEAAAQLRIVCELIGKRSDPRYEEAERKLLEVQSRLNIRKR